MFAASGKDDTDDPSLEEKANALLQPVAAGDITNLGEATSWINELRLESQHAINLRREKISALQKEIDTNRKSREKITIIWFPILNLTGLFFVLLKDVPIWRTRR